LQLDTDTGQLVLWCLGEAHADVALDRLATKYGVAVDQQDLRVGLRETFAAATSGLGRHVKQSGGHGQFAICRIEVEPLPSGAGFEFVDKVVGGSSHANSSRVWRKASGLSCRRGVRAGYPVVDLRVTLIDGKAHSVDSSDMAFQMAGALALREAAAAGAVTLLEPVLEISILIDEDHVGAVMADLSSKRGRVMGTELSASGAEGSGRTLIHAEVPEAELIRYASELRSLSHGTGTFTRRYLRHEAVPESRATASSR